MKDQFPVDYSHLSANALAKRISSDYGIDVVWMNYYCGGFNDTYKLRTDDGSVYYFRVYRPIWRTLSAIRYELDAINHLEEKRFPAIRILHRKDGEQLCAFNAPEGKRFGILSAEAPGKEISYDKDVASTSFQYGQNAAAMHIAMQDFTSMHDRRPLDIHFLAQSVLKNAKPFLEHRPEDWAYLQAFSNRIKWKLESLPINALPHGFCHGDLQGHHCNIDENGVMTFYDFDCCGYGATVYDLAVFRWFTRLENQEKERWSHFLRGYQDVRPLSLLEVDSIPAFVACRYLWHISVHTLNAGDWGVDWLGDVYFDKRIAMLKKLEGDYPGMI